MPRMAKRTTKARKPVEFNSEELISSVALGPTEEWRLLSYCFRGHAMVNLRKFRLMRGAWVHTSSGFLMSEKSFIEVASLVRLGAEMIEAATPPPET